MHLALHTEWAIVAWDLPADRMDIAESYLIGYVLARWRCVNGNRGNSDHAFKRGFLDASHGEPPQICAPFEMDGLQWRHVGNSDDNPNFIDVPEGGSELWAKRWGFHLVAHDIDKVIESEIAPREEELRRWTNELRNNEENLSSRPRELFALGLASGVLAGMLVTILLTMSK